MWLKYLTVFIFIIVVIRLILIMTGEMSAHEKIKKTSNWIIGVVLLLMSWNIIKAIFPSVDIGNFGDEEVQENNVPYEQNEFDRTNSSQDSTTVRIKFRGDK